MENSFLRSKAKKRWSIYGRKENSSSLLITFFIFRFSQDSFLCFSSLEYHRETVESSFSSYGGQPANHPPRVFMSEAVSVCLQKMGWCCDRKPSDKFFYIYFFSMITTSITVNILLLNGSEIVVIYSLKWIVKKVFFSCLVEKSFSCRFTCVGDGGRKVWIIFRDIWH